MLIDRNCRFVAVNAAYEAATLRSRDELVGAGLFDLFPNEGEGGRRLRASLQRVFDTGEQDTLAYLAYDIPRPAEAGGGMEQRYWTAVHVPVRGSDGMVDFVLQNTVDVTEVARIREAASLPFRSRPVETALIERAREAEEAQRAALADSEDFRRLFKQAPSFITVLTGPNHVFTFVNDAYRRLIGGREVVGATVAEALPEVVGQGFIELLDAVYSDGVQRGGEGMRVMLQQAPGTEPVETFLDFSYSPIRDLAGAITGIFVQGMDRTSAVHEERRQKLLLDELNHRVKNTLATVQSIAAQTFKRDGDIAAARASFERRLISLSRTHDMLSERRWADAELGTIVERELSAFGDGRATVNGPSIVLNAKSAIALSMVLNELAANAARHGSLSVPAGTIAVTWVMRDPETLLLNWRETGGPVVEQPSYRGFGARMTERVVAGELAGSVASHYGAEGFQCELALPLHVLTETANEFA